MAEGKEELLSKLLDSVPVLLIILGVLLFSLGLSGGITYKQWFTIPETEPRLAAALAGIVVFGLGVARSRVQVVTSARKYGIKIDHPRDGDAVDIVDVRGSISKPLPGGYTLKVFRIYPGTNSYVPLGDARIDIESGRWEAERCDIGGRPGDKRSIAAYLVGPNGAILLDYYAMAKRAHRSVMDDLLKATGKEGAYLPSIEKRTLDMIECNRVSVLRKQR
jgi:hypothetical protein